MAPPDPTPNHDLVEQQINTLLQSLFQILIQTSSYDQAGRPTQSVLAGEFSALSHSLAQIHHTALSSSLKPVQIPDLLVSYVERGRNPDIYTREFVELVRRLNQLARGKQRAFTGFRDVLAREMASALPECAEDVERVVGETNPGRGRVGGNGS